jgi:hypothetical protein
VSEVNYLYIPSSQADRKGQHSDTHSLASIGPDLARLESVCFEFYRNSILSALAVPDVLEGEDPIALNYEQIEKMAVDTWTHFETFFKPVRSGSLLPVTPSFATDSINL